MAVGFYPITFAGPEKADSFLINASSKICCADPEIFAIHFF